MVRKCVDVPTHTDDAAQIVERNIDIRQLRQNFNELSIKVLRHVALKQKTQQFVIVHAGRVSFTNRVITKHLTFVVVTIIANKSTRFCVYCNLLDTIYPALQLL